MDLVRGTQNAERLLDSQFTFLNWGSVRGMQLRFPGTRARNPHEESVSIVPHACEREDAHFRRQDNQCGYSSITVLLSLISANKLGLTQDSWCCFHGSDWDGLVLSFRTFPGSTWTTHTCVSKTLTFLVAFGGQIQWSKINSKLSCCQSQATSDGVWPGCLDRESAQRAGSKRWWSVQRTKPLQANLDDTTNICCLLWMLFCCLKKAFAPKWRGNAVQGTNLQGIWFRLDLSAPLFHLTQRSYLCTHASLTFVSHNTTNPAEAKDKVAKLEMVKVSLWKDKRIRKSESSKTKGGFPIVLCCLVERSHALSAKLGWSCFFISKSKPAERRGDLE